MKTLLKRGAEVNAVSSQGVTPLMFAALYANQGNFQMLLEHGAQLECAAHTDGRLLESAVSSPWRPHGSDRREIVRFLLDNGHSRVLQGDTGARILNAYTDQNIEIMTWLIKAGAGVDGHPSFSWKPLINAVVNGREAIVRLLLTHGANANIQDNEGRTALMHAVLRPYA